jgi:uncharacterized protein (TIGR00730 family)
MIFDNMAGNTGQFRAAPSGDDPWPLAKRRKGKKPAMMRPPTEQVMKEEKPANVAQYPLAYKNEKFLDSDDARALRILAEYLEPLYRFEQQKVPGTVVFFGSARLTPEAPLGRYYADARTLARLFTEWSNGLPPAAPRYLICSGGGHGIMEAANRGAADAGGRTIGLNISLPEEQTANAYITPNLSFEFHYFFMRKLWFAHLARAVIVFPGGFGTLDELSEILTLSQTHKLEGKMTVILYGQEYWNEVINLPALVKHGMIHPSDLELFSWANSPEQAMVLLKQGLAPWLEAAAPAYAKTRARHASSYLYQRSGD